MRIGYWRSLKNTSTISLKKLLNNFLHEIYRNIIQFLSFSVNAEGVLSRDRTLFSDKGFKGLPVENKLMEVTYKYVHSLFKKIAKQLFT